ncbi:hypothetical protein CRG98_050300, partial [Punica granatum]
MLIRSSCGLPLLQLIPSDFLKQFKGKIPNQATLKDHAGRSWSVQLKEVGSKLFIKNGWEEFVTDHSLGFGDFLIFSYYHSTSVFHVKIFGKNGCRKKRACAANKTLLINLEEEEQVEERVEETSAGGPYENHRKRPRIGALQGGTSENRVEKPFVPKHPHFVSPITSSTNSIM